MTYVIKLLQDELRLLKEVVADKKAFENYQEAYKDRLAKIKDIENALKKLEL